MNTSDHSVHSSYRESLLEHLLVGEVLRALWLKGHLVEVMKPQVDDSGYDLVFEMHGITRHAQLKSSFRGARTARQNVHRRLEAKPSGCVVWVQFDPGSLALGPFFWLGGRPGQRLPSLDRFKVARHTKGNAAGVKHERKALRVVPKSAFERLESIDQLISRLFGGTTGDGSERDTER